MLGESDAIDSGQRDSRRSLGAESHLKDTYPSSTMTTVPFIASA